MNDAEVKTNDKEFSLVQAIRARTPARLLVGRSGPAYRTETQLQLRLDHAAARDAVHAELDDVWLAEMQLPSFQTLAASKGEYLLRPDLGRCFNEAARRTLTETFPKNVDWQIVVGDGLSATARALR